uniref:Uncharacterized protein n=1 Tax=Panagrolaimus sp. PS1159 TaxID=55785 RepID=A0AC35GN49_9BILA
MNFYLTAGIDSRCIFVEEEDLCFPHSRLKECLRGFESITSCLPSKKLIMRYEEMMKLYRNIVSAYEDVDKWFNFLLEVDDFAFIKENIESRLGNDFVNVHLWKIYFGFLKKHDEYKSLLKAYSKYCRFFLDDKEMLDEYKKVMTEYGPVKLEWKNLFDFEGEDVAENESASFEMEEVVPLENESANVEMEEVEPFDKKICTLFYDTYQCQNFSLPGPQIFYILNNADHRMLRKLFASCKYFFVKHPTPICYGLSKRYQTSFKKENLDLSRLSNPIMFVKNTFITGRIVAVRRNTVKLSANDPERLFISSLIPHLFRCEAKYLSIVDQSLSFDEVKFLISHGNVVEFCLPDSTILDECGQYVHLEEIMKYLPNVEELVLPNIKVNSETGHALTKLKFNSRIFIFSIWAIFGDPFDENEFLKFVKANRDDKLDLEMSFNEEFNREFEAKLWMIMKCLAVTMKLAVTSHLFNKLC